MGANCSQTCGRNMPAAAAAARRGPAQDAAAAQDALQGEVSPAAALSSTWNCCVINWWTINVVCVRDDG